MTTTPGFSLEGRVAIVTGAAGLLGKHHVRALRSAGAHVVLADIALDPVAAFARDLAKEDVPARGELLAWAVDITDKVSLAKMRDGVLDKFGRIDALVNNAAINDKFESPEAGAELSKFENYPIELWQRSLDVNVTGMFLACQAIAPLMAKEKRGSIVNVASTYGMVGPDQSIYVRPGRHAKLLQVAFVSDDEGRRFELPRAFGRPTTGNGRECPREQPLLPGGVEAGQDANFIANYSKKTPLGRMAKPHDIGGAVVFLASDASAYITGANLVVDGGWTAW